jgi:O-antigen/teichoic acid export membrane protein
MPSAVAAEPPAYGSPRTPAPPRVSRGDSLRSRTIRGTLWTTGGYGISLVLRLGINLVLTRLLAPPMFGVMSLVNIFIQGLQGFSDVGIGPAIIQSKRGDDPAFLNTAWTIQVLRGFALGGVSALIAWPVAKLYGDRQLLWLLPVAGSTALIAGFNSTAVFTLNRHLDVAKLTVLNLIGQVAGAFVMIGWALKWPSVWARRSSRSATATRCCAARPTGSTGTAPRCRR